MDGKMKVAIMTDVMKMELTKRDIPKPENDEVLVKIEYVGVCGSDLHYFEAGGIGANIVKPPFVLGHEAGGVVVEIGSEVRNLNIGDKVALEPGKPCGKCEFCKTGRYNICPDVIFFATPPVDGVFQEYVAHKAELCFKIPDNMDTMEAALIEPLAVGLHAARQGNAHLGQVAVVTGAGCIGLVSAMSLKAMGVTKIIVVDVQEKRLKKAVELGATDIINAKTQNTVDEVMRLTNGAGADLTIETAGTESTTTQSIQFSKKGSTIVLVGYSASGKMNLPMSLALDKELEIKTVFRYRHIYPIAIDAVSSGTINLKGIVTNKFELDDIQNAMVRSIKDKANIVKSVIKIC